MSLHSPSSSSSGASGDESNDFEDAWTKLEKSLEDNMDNMWDLAVSGLPTDINLIEALKETLAEDNTSVRNALTREKGLFLETMAGIRRKYAGKQSQIRNRVRQEKIRIKTFFSNILAQQKQKLETLVREKAKNINVAIEGNIEAFQEHWNKPENIQLIDRSGFFLGVMLMCAIEGMMLLYPERIPSFYCYATLPLLLLRYITYHEIKFHYFMLDFCYYVQAVLHYFLLKEPGSRVLFISLFAWSNGPLMWAIIFWRNSLVFHSLNRFTSSYIHVVPALVMFCIRWYPTPEHKTLLNLEVQMELPFSELFGYPVFLYVFWQIMYLIKTEWIDRSKLKDDGDIETSLRYLKKSYLKKKAQSSSLYKIANIFGHEYVTAMFVMLQMAYTLISLVPIKFLYENYTLHCAYIIFIFGVNVWNGAGYYGYKFARHRDLEPTRSFSGRREEPWYNTWIRRGNINKSPTKRSDKDISIDSSSPDSRQVTGSIGEASFPNSKIK